MPVKKSSSQKIDQNFVIFIVASVVILLSLTGALYGQGLIGAHLLDATTSLSTGTSAR